MEGTVLEIKEYVTSSKKVLVTFTTIGDVKLIGSENLLLSY